MDKLTGIHEPTVVIPRWLVINPTVVSDFYNCLAYNCIDGFDVTENSRVRTMNHE